LLEEEDLPAMKDMAKEPDTFRYIRKLRVMTEPEYQQFLLLKLEQIRTGIGYHWAIWLKEDGSFIGAVNLNRIGNSTMMQIGCQLKKERWEQGFASELMERVVDFALLEAGITPIYGVFESDNMVSRRLMEKLGFTLIEKRADNGVDIEIHRLDAEPR
jgi:ribosomal-protein-alanine N-acetyltransferase